MQNSLSFTFEETIRQLNEKVARRGINYSLDRLTNALTELSHPHLNLPPVIHIAGTNGKGSVAHYITQGLMALDATVITYTSPHILTYTERLKINNTPISNEHFMTLFDQVNCADNRHQLSEYECLTIMAFLLANDIQPDFIVLETGLGGRLDATNVVLESIAVITDIHLDHMDILGPTLSHIATEKAGIIKPNSPIFTHIDQPTEVVEVIKQKAKSQQATLHWSSPNTDFHSRNKALASNVLSYLFPFSEKIISSVMTSVKPPFGRLTPLVYQGIPCQIDVGHNVAALDAILQLQPGIEEWIVGMQTTKDYISIISKLIHQNVTVKLCEFDPNICVKMSDLPAELSRKISLWRPDQGINQNTLFFGSFFFIDKLINGGDHA
ncbi:MAG: Mur ligase family protein [Candidatus Margulisiibacteriota bacterium]